MTHAQNKHRQWPYQIVGIWSPDIRTWTRYHIVLSCSAVVRGNSIWTGRQYDSVSLKLVSLKYANSDGSSQIAFVKSKTVRAKNTIDKREVCLIILNIRDLKTCNVEGHYASIDATFLFFQLFNPIFSGIDIKYFRYEIEITKGSNMGYARLSSGFIGFLRCKLTNLILKIKKNV